MVGMAAALYYLEVKDKQSVKNFVSTHVTQLNLFACVCFATLIAISFVNKQVVLHSVVYMPISVILFIIIALTGGGYPADIYSPKVWSNQFCILPRSSNVLKIFAFNIR